jgi:putative FmdB family regulatory protein
MLYDCGIMPIYEYQCESCHRLTEALLKVGEKGPRKCPHCGGKLTRVISRTSFQLKGGGWYKDLYASTKPESGDSSSTESASGDVKAAEKPSAIDDGKADKPAKPESKPESKTEPKKASEKAASAKATKPTKKTG